MDAVKRNMPRTKKGKDEEIPAQSKPAENDTTLTMSELKAMMTSIANEVFEARGEKLKSEIEDECEYQVYIQSEEIEQTFEKFQKQLKSRAETTDFRKIVEEHCSNTLDSKMKSTNDEIEAMKTENLKMKRRLEKLQFQLSCKDAKIEELNLKIDEIEQKQYNRSVRIVGMPEEEDDPSDIKNIQKIAKSVFAMEVKKSDVEETYRLGKVTEKKKNRDLIIKFKKKSIRDQFYNNRKKLVPTPDQPNVFINEQLTEHRANLFYAARKLVKSNKIHSAWSQRGNILVRKEEGDKPRQVSTHEQLTKIRGDGNDSELEDNSVFSDPQTSDEED